MFNEAVNSLSNENWMKRAGLSKKGKKMYNNILNKFCS